MRTVSREAEAHTNQNAVVLQMDQCNNFLFIYKVCIILPLGIFSMVLLKIVVSTIQSNPRVHADETNQD